MKRFSLILLFLFVTMGFSAAQSLEVTGKVFDKQTDEPLIGANISIKGTNLGTVSDMDGKFHIKLPHFKSATLVFSYIGYKTVKVKVKGNTYDMKVGMEPDILKTSEVVISGLASSVKRENAANSVATVSARELTEVPTETLDGELSGKIAGVTVSATSGAPGGGFYVNLRGVGTINAESQPLYVLDGVILDNTATQSGVNAVTKATGGGSTNYQDNPVNRIADLVPDDIKSIEVLKGPSAAAIYGAKASNGVVIITTKQGSAGKSSFTFRQQFGVNVLAKKLGSRKFTAETAKEYFGDVGLKEFQKGKTYDHEEELYGRKGFVNQSSVGLGGGNQTSQYYISMFTRNDQGIIQNTGYDKQSVRINLSHKLSERVNVKVFANYIRSSSDRGLTNNDNSGTSFGMALAGTPSFLNLQPVNGVYPENPFVASNPLQTAALMTNNETVHRTIVSGKVRVNLIRTEKQLLDFTAVGGVDGYTQINKAVFPRELQFEKYSSQPGTVILGETVSHNDNLYLNLIHNYFISSDVSFRTALGLQYENKNLNHTLSVGEDVIIGQENIDQAASVTVDQNRIIQRDRGFFAQEEVNVKDIYFFTAGIRGDASSSNGNVHKYFLFPKASASVRLSKFDFWNPIRPYVSGFKVRAAYGKTGNSPIPGAKYSSFVPANVDGKGGLVVATRKGNPNIEPEKTTEIEVGFDADFFGDKGTFEFSYYNKNISDLILFRNLPPSTGYAQEVINGGKMNTYGFEASLGWAVFNTKDFRWTTRVNFYKTHSTITQLDVPAFNTIGFADVLGRFRVEEGKSATQIVGLENGVLKQIGDETPDFQMSFINNFKWHQFDLNFLWDWKQGGDVINLTKLLTDLFGTSPDLDTPEGKARAAAFGKTTHQFVEDGSYLKLREISFGYTFKPQTVRKFFGGIFSKFRVGVSGRNILTFTKYSSYDPEVSNFGFRAIGHSIEVTPFPASKSYYFNIMLGF